MFDSECGVHVIFCGLDEKNNSAQGKHCAALMMHKGSTDYGTKGGRIMPTYGERGVSIRFPLSDSDGRTTWMSFSRGYAVQQSSSNEERGDFYGGLGILFDQGSKEDVHI